MITRNGFLIYQLDYIDLPCRDGRGGRGGKGGRGGHQGGTNWFTPSGRDLQIKQAAAGSRQQTPKNLMTSKTLLEACLWPEACSRSVATV